MSAPNPPREPSMEEILASIRRIIAEDSADKAETAHEDVLVLTDEVEGPATPPATKAAAKAGDDGRVLSRQAAQRVEASFADLVQAMQQQTAAEPDEAPRSGSPLDPLVLEALRPALRDWLDRNLAPLVERVVREEIARLAKRASEL